ncbi:MAG: N-6 DNA methylase, partial [Chloroflexota bacterium]
MTIALSQLASAFGTKSDLARQLIPILYEVLSKPPEYFRKWLTQFSATISHLKTDKLARHYQIGPHQPVYLVYALQTYYVAIVKALVACRVNENIEAADCLAESYFQNYGIQNFGTTNEYPWYIAPEYYDDIIKLASRCDFDNPVPDALKTLYHDLFPNKLRHALGEYYTPDWFAHFVLDRIEFNRTQRLLDPTCGSGTFTTLAYRRLLDAQIESPLNYIAGIDINPLAVLSAKANLLLNMPRITDDVYLPIYCADVLLNPPNLGEFDLIVGNPPWVNWETLPEDYRQQTKKLWEHYGLFPHSGFDAILGKGKKDLSLVLTYAVVDHYLKKQGKLAFIMTQSVLKTGGANEGFRQFKFEQELQPAHVDDFSKLRLFTGAETKPIVIVLSHDVPERPTYTIWQADKKTIRDDAPRTIINTLQSETFIAEPISGLGSAWLTGKPNALRAVRKIIGQSDYIAHANVYTGGANAVYWLDVLQREGDKVYVQNVTQGAKRKVKQVEAWLEADLVYPLLRGRDVSRWQANPTCHILMVQNPITRQGYNEDWLKAKYPLTFAYLQQFEATLKQRATYKRYFHNDVPFYTMFDIGEYTFRKYKVIWHGFGKKRMEAVVVGSIDDKLIMGNQAMHPFIGLNDEDEAHYLAACLNSAPFEFAVLSH